MLKYQKVPTHDYDLVPLLIGLATLAAFTALEGYPRLTPSPMMPLYLFKNSVTSLVFLLSFLHVIVTLWVIYFLPVYFQGVLTAQNWSYIRCLALRKRVFSPTSSLKYMCLSAYHVSSRRPQTGRTGPMNLQQQLPACES